MPNLPNEVWVQIFGYFEYPFEAKSDQPAHEPRTVHEPWREGLRVLARCCRVSARFLGLARPVLYRRLPLEEEEIRLSSLLRTLAERPLLAQYVECIMQDNRHGLSLKAFRSLVGQYYDTPPNLSRSQRHNKRIRYTGPPPSLSSLEGFEAEVRCPSYSSRRQGGSEMWHAHCAGLMPNLKVFNCLITAKDKFIPAMIRQAADIGAVRAVEDAKDPHKESQETGLARIYQQDSGPTLGVPLPLAKLEELAVSHHRPTRMPTAAVSLEKFQDLFFLPRLIRFYGHGVTLNNTPAKDDQTSEQQRPRRVSSLAHVHLRSSFADAQSICNLLRTCPSLRTLKISWGQHAIGDSYLDFDEIGRALREHGASLEALDLYPNACHSYQSNNWREKIGSLRPLQLLTYLAMSGNILLGKERNEHEEDTAMPLFDDLEALLPESLETLHLYSTWGEEEWFRKTIQGILSSQRLARLKKVLFSSGALYDVIWDLTDWQCYCPRPRARFHSMFDIEFCRIPKTARK